MSNVRITAGAEVEEMNDSESLRIRRLKDLIRTLCRITDYTLSIIDYKGTILESTGVKNEDCKRRREEGDEECASCQVNVALEAAGAAVRQKPKIFVCDKGYYHFVVPIIVDDRYFGAITGGMVKEKDHMEDVISLVEMFLSEIMAKENDPRLRESVQLKKHLEDLRRYCDRQEESTQRMKNLLLRGKILPDMLLDMLVMVSNFAILENAKQTETTIENLASVLRYYTQSDRDIVDLKTEFEQIKTYVDVLDKQYDGRVCFRIHCDPMVGNYRIPSLGLFTYLNYVISNGIRNTHFQGVVYISADMWKGDCHISFQMESSNENYQYDMRSLVDMEIRNSQMLEQQLSNTRQRFEDLYGEGCHIEIRSNMIDIEIAG